MLCVVMLWWGDDMWGYAIGGMLLGGVWYRGYAMLGDAIVIM